VRDNPIALRDQIDDLHLKVRERAPKRAHPPLRDLGKLPSRDVIENGRFALANGLVNPAAAPAVCCPQQTSKSLE
jgi:hypothetical protein